MIETVKRALKWLDIAGFALGLLAAWFLRPHSSVWRVGMTVAGVFFVPWLVAKAQLGSAFSLVPEARHLVTHGLYARIRHPIYIFGSAALLGASLALLQSWPLIGFGLVVACVLEVLRARQEERLLRAAFGEEYERYRRSTWL